MKKSKKTAIVEASENKRIIQGLDYQDFKIVCSELNIVEEALRELWDITQDTETDNKLKSDIFKWLVEMNVGKARQSTDITSDGNKLTAGIFVSGNIDSED